MSRGLRRFASMSDARVVYLGILLTAFMAVFGLYATVSPLLLAMAAVIAPRRRVTPGQDVLTRTRQ